MERGVEDLLRARLMALACESGSPRQADEIQRKASTAFALAELVRRPK